MVERIFASLTPLVRSGMRIADLYCGAGTFALFFASRGATVFGIEENGAAVSEARANAEDFGEDFGAGELVAQISAHFTGNWRTEISNARAGDA